MITEILDQIEARAKGALGPGDGHAFARLALAYTDVPKLVKALRRALLFISIITKQVPPITESGHYSVEADIEAILKEKP